MTPFLVLIGSWILFRCLGWLGVRQLNPWNATSAYALALVFLFTGATHLRAASTSGD